VTFDPYNYKIATSSSFVNFFFHLFRLNVGYARPKNAQQGKVLSKKEKSNKRKKKSKHPMGRRGGSSSLVRQIGVTKPLLSHLKVVSATPIWSFCGGLATPNHLIVVLASPICGQTTPYIYIYIYPFA
jgi:hypothetical protein